MNFQHYQASLKEQLLNYRKLFAQSPVPLHKAISYVLETQGKLIRGCLTLASCEACGTHFSQALPLATAIELIQAYSLIHDDLPAMDNDVLRRSRYTVHVVFDDAQAILTGDALLSDAFALVTQVAPRFEPRLGYLVALLSQSIGSQGMCLGQSLDMTYTKVKSQEHDLSHLQLIHQKKTGSLIGAACGLGATLSSHPNWKEHAARFREFGEQIGLAYQMIDDLLDDEQTMGKTKGKDQTQGKLSFKRFYSQSEIKEKARIITEQAVNKLKNYGHLDVEGLESFSRQLLNRLS